MDVVAVRKDDKASSEGQDRREGREPSDEVHVV
jgi:hypothetical protein